MCGRGPKGEDGEQWAQPDTLLSYMVALEANRSGITKSYPLPPSQSPQLYESREAANLAASASAMHKPTFPTHQPRINLLFPRPLSNIYAGGGDSGYRIERKGKE